VRERHTLLDAVTFMHMVSLVIVPALVSARRPGVSGGRRRPGRERMQ
jgi:hypothetical protein